MVEAWAWQPDANEWIPDLVVHEPTEEQVRYTGIPVLAVEILSTDRAGDLLRKAHGYAAAGLPQYWVIDPDGPEIIEYRLTETGDAYREVGRHGGDEPVALPVGGLTAKLVPDDLVS